MFRAIRERSRLESTVLAKSFSGERQGAYFGESAGSAGLRIPRDAECCRSHPDFEAGNL
jgi:hypothetical protein